jgi:hypothetical protein
LAGELKRTGALLRDTRMVLRRLDRLVDDAGDEPVRRDLEALREACERAVARLAQREQALQRQAREAIRQLR